jgi:hypothetical protein
MVSEIMSFRIFRSFYGKQRRKCAKGIQIRLMHRAPGMAPLLIDK